CISSRGRSREVLEARIQVSLAGVELELHLEVKRPQHPGDIAGVVSGIGQRKRPVLAFRIADNESNPSFGQSVSWANLEHDHAEDQQDGGSQGPREVCFAERFAVTLHATAFNLMNYDRNTSCGPPIATRGNIENRVLKVGPSRRAQTHS